MRCCAEAHTWLRSSEHSHSAEADGKAGKTERHWLGNTTQRSDQHSVREGACLLAQNAQDLGASDGGHAADAVQIAQDDADLRGRGALSRELHDDVRGLHASGVSLHYSSSRGFEHSTLVSGPAGRQLRLCGGKTLERIKSHQIGGQPEMLACRRCQALSERGCDGALPLTIFEATDAWGNSLLQTGIAIDSSVI